VHANAKVQGDPTGIYFPWTLTTSENYISDKENAVKYGTKLISNQFNYKSDEELLHAVNEITEGDRLACDAGCM
jgi:hypothetical protein